MSEKKINKSPTKKTYSKYKVKQDEKSKKDRTVFDEHLNKEFKFASNIEKKFYDEVVLPYFKSGDIIDYDMQKKYVLQEKFRHPSGELIREVSYLADYWIKLKDGKEYVLDTKGNGLLIDSVATLKRKLLMVRYPDIDFHWITWSKATSWVDWHQLMKEKKANKKKNEEKEK